jgi:hypothetical protein
MRKPHLAVLLLLAIFLALRASAQNSGSGGATFSLTISLPQASVPVGSGIPLDIRMTNVTDHEISYGIGCAPFYEFDVRDNQGRPAKETEKNLRLHFKDPKFVMQDAVTCQSAHIYPLGPGKTYEDNFKIGDYYDFSRPGRYTIQAEREDFDTKVLVKSNTVTLTVTP